MPALNALPRFTDDVGQVISATDLALIRDNIALIDALSFRQMPAFDSSGDVTGLNGPGHYHATDWFWGTTETIWWGAFRFRTGYTTLTLTGATTGSPLGTVTVYLNGISRLAWAPTAGAISQTITISSLGFADGDVVTIEIILSGTHTTTGAYVFYDIYAGPVTYGTSYPGVPSFSGQYTATKLNQLVDAAAWCYNRMALTPIVPGLAHVGAQGPYAPAGLTELYRGAVLRSYSQDSLRILGDVISVSTVSYKLHVYIGGSLIYSSATQGIGYYLADLDISLSTVTVGTRADLSIWIEIIDPGPNTTIPWRKLRYSLYSMRSAGAYPYASTLTALAGYTDITATTLNTALNAYASAVTAVKARIDTDTHIWARARAMRKWYEPVVSSRRTEAGLAHRYVPRFHQRLGDIVIVRGKALKIGWGPVTAPIETEGDLGFDKWVMTHEATATEADTTATQTVYLDGMKGLYPGAAYFVIGGADYAEENLI
jgi:hypothetical protein